MPVRHEPAITRIRELFDFDPTTGVVWWKVRRRGRFARPGTKLRSTTSNGYLSVCVDGRRCGVHRLIWALHFGGWPKGEIDHINGSRTDNRLQNLRLATSSQNHCNSKPRRGGMKGVSKHRNSWVAQITVNKRRIYLGSFASQEAAHAAYWKAARQYHREFARKQ